MCPDIMSRFWGAQTGESAIRSQFAGSYRAMATEAKLLGATTIIGVDTVPARLAMSKRMGADHVVDFRKEDSVEAIMRLTDGRGVDVAIEALGTQTTFEAALRVIRPGGVLSKSLGVYSSDLKIPLDAFAAGLGDKSIRTSLCPGGKERMRRMLAVISSGRVSRGTSHPSLQTRADRGSL